MPGRPIDRAPLHRLRVLVAVVERGSLTAAARHLGIARSGVSTHLQRLEDELGVRLMERTTRRRHLTEVGQGVYDAARRMLDAAEDAVHVAEQHLGTVAGVLRVSFPIDLGPPLVTPAVEQLCRRHPALRFELLAGDEPVDLVRDGVDVAVRMGIPTESTLLMQRLAVTDEILVAAPGLAARLDGAAPADLADAPAITHHVESRIDPVYHHPDGREVRQTWGSPVARVSTSVVSRNLAAAGVGVTVLPELVVADALASGQLVRVAAPWRRRHLSVYALTVSRQRSPRRRAFLEALRAQLAPG